MMHVSRLSVMYIGPEPRTARPRKTKISTEVAHALHDSDTTFKVKRSKVSLQGEWHIVVASCTACWNVQDNSESSGEMCTEFRPKTNQLRFDPTQRNGPGPGVKHFTPKYGHITWLRVTKFGAVYMPWR